MDSHQLPYWLAPPSLNGPTSLIHRLFTEAQKEFNDSNKGLRPPPAQSWKTSSCESLQSSRRVSNEAPSLSDTLVASAEEQLLDESYDLYSRTFHMVLMDSNYDVFTSPKGYGSVIYKIAQRTLVVVGDPMCSKDHIPLILEELRLFRRTRRLKLAFMGASQFLLKYADAQGWTSFNFGCERVINPLSNQVLDNKAGKRMLSQNRQLLNPKKGGLRIKFYAPCITGIDSRLERQLGQLYGDWCSTKTDKGGLGNTQAFITAYDMFSDRSRTKISFLYVTDSHGENGDEGNVCGLAMLRQLGANCGFHIDPCIASADAPRGTTDLLMVTAMKLLRQAKISYLSLGVEPGMALAEKNVGRQDDGPKKVRLTDRLAYSAYRRVTNEKAVSGKRIYNDKFHPDPTLETELYVIFPRATFPVQEALAIMKVAHIRPKHLFT